MKITTFNPQIITSDAESLAKLFEELGFEKKHCKKAVGEYSASGLVMKDPNGFKVDISQPDLSFPQDIVCIRINVDDFQEAYQFFMSQGFENFYGDSSAVTSSSRSAVLRSPTGFSINLVEHIKDHK